MRNSATKELELLVAIMSVRGLEEQHGHISCFNTPRAYTQMEVLHNKIDTMTKELSKEVDGVSAKGIYKIYEDIAKDAQVVYHMDPTDIAEAIEGGVVQFQIYDIHDFLEQYVLREEKNDLFSELLWFADIETRVSYLQDKFLCDLDIYYSRFLDYLVLFEVDEGALKAMQSKRIA